MTASNDTRNGIPTWRFHWILCAFLAIAGVFLFLEHRAHLLGALPFLLLLACPVLHLFMHGRHGSHGGHDHDAGSRPAERP